MLSVVILAHNKLELTRRCLSALAHAVAGIEHEIVCVDNASTEDARTLENGAGAFQRFRLIRNDDNLSFSVANNRAAALCNGNTLLFLNNDVLAARGSVKSLLTALAYDPTIGCAGAKLIYPSRKVQHAGIVQMLWGYVSNYGVGGTATDPRFRQTCDRFAVTGAMACLPRPVFEMVNGFDERYRWGYEDVDLCLKVRAAGFRVTYVSEAESIHEESATLSGVRRAADLAHNYRLFRNTWKDQLERAESAYVDDLKACGVRRVVVLGMGQAALGLARVLLDSGIEIVAFTSSHLSSADHFHGVRALPLESLRQLHFDRLIVASQYFFELEESIKSYDPTESPIFPAIA
jgi:GT2 family glycosyltransferase